MTYRKYYFFDIKNPSEILDGEKPVLVERGPYTFREENHRHNIEHLDNNRTSFSLVKTLYFEPELSVGNKTDLIVFLNVPAMVTHLTFYFYTAFSKLFTIKGMIETSDKNTHFPYSSILKLYNIKLFIKKSVGEMVSGLLPSFISYHINNCILKCTSKLWRLMSIFSKISFLSLLSQFPMKVASSC